MEEPSSLRLLVRFKPVLIRLWVPLTGNPSSPCSAPTSSRSPFCASAARSTKRAGSLWWKEQRQRACGQSRVRRTPTIAPRQHPDRPLGSEPPIVVAHGAPVLVRHQDRVPKLRVPSTPGCSPLASRPHLHPFQIQPDDCADVAVQRLGEVGVEQESRCHGDETGVPTERRLEPSRQLAGSSAATELGSAGPDIIASPRIHGPDPIALQMVEGYAGEVLRPGGPKLRRSSVRVGSASA
jgi:hypothetical protein